MIMRNSLGGSGLRRDAVQHQTRSPTLIFSMALSPCSVATFVPATKQWFAEGESELLTLANRALALVALPDIALAAR